MEILVSIACALYLLSAVSYLIFLFKSRARYQRWGTRLLLSGFLVHSAALVLGFVQARHIPVRNLYETLSFAAWALAGGFLVVQHKFKIKLLGAWAAPLVALIVAVATLIPREPVAAQPISTVSGLFFMWRRFLPARRPLPWPAASAFSTCSRRMPSNPSATAIFTNTCRHWNYWIQRDTPAQQPTPP